MECASLFHNRRKIGKYSMDFIESPRILVIDWYIVIFKSGFILIHCSLNWTYHSSFYRKDGILNNLCEPRWSCFRNVARQPIRCVACNMLKIVSQSSLAAFITVHLFVVNDRNFSIREIIAKPKSLILMNFYGLSDSIYE